ARAARDPDLRRAVSEVVVQLRCHHVGLRRRARDVRAAAAPPLPLDQGDTRAVLLQGHVGTVAGRGSSSDHDQVESFSHRASFLVAGTLRGLIEQHFGESEAWSRGLEEEIMILDAETHGLSPGVKSLVEWAEDRELPGVL